MRDTGSTQLQHTGDVVLGDDWVAPRGTVSDELRARRDRRGFFSLRGSPLTRKIIVFNLIALIILAAGLLYLNGSRDDLVVQRANTLAGEARLIANVFEAQLPKGGPVNLVAGDGVDVADTLAALTLREGMEVFVYDPAGQQVGETIGTGAGLPRVAEPEGGRTLISDGLSAVWEAVAAVISPAHDSAGPLVEDQLAALLPNVLEGRATRVETLSPGSRSAELVALTPILQGGHAVGAVALLSPAGEIEALVRGDRERVLQMFVVALLVSVGLSLVLASTIANPLRDLAEAAELGRDRNARKMNPGRVRIPDLTARPDEIGRLSRALRGMVSALYNRIDGNEQFAADVAHEIKNPLASLQSAVGTLRMVKREDQRDKLLDVIEHDVRRLDRLVSDISNASRLDAELVKEEQETFDLLIMLGNLNQYLGEDARARGIDYITDLPEGPITIHGLEARLAQVFVNLITNAISFCEEGDAIRVWVRKRKNRVLVVVEDTGPGIPEEALGKIFKRFYSERPEEHFGNNSGLGLAISKQIVEAHDGVIWAENIRPTEADATSDPLGARFVVGLPV
ncbi:sensor histidine kinase [Pseudodonghicola flavimaris]|uniref:histidine kinase n=1 Tax=Pseudodonghicola flavimaris TaxID=3050036 RepID=A0ABT7F6H3_9RHOB|nr:sensor histidine kinase [Pseudodonghicola flavimaris]MDK3020215.1 sensor histidine kinase [Pseudodonghicola flavimaris]